MKKTSPTTELNPLEAEIAVTRLQATGDFKILRRINLDNDPRLTRRRTANPSIGLCIDTETTGLDYSQDKIIEIGIVAFEYDPITAEIGRITERHSGFEDPGIGISAEITAITGITDEMVKGKSFDCEAIERLANQSSIVIAHNASFDRKFIEARFPSFSKLPWACSLNQIDWQSEGFASRILEYLLFKFDSFIDAHRALNDSEGVLSVLLETLPSCNHSAFKSLLNACMMQTSKIYAVGAPFDMKDVLKSRGYRWNDGTQGGSKAWWKDVPEEDEKLELDWLEKEVYGKRIPDNLEICRTNAIDRFSIREK